MQNAIFNKLPLICLMTQKLNRKGLKKELIAILNIIELYKRVYI